MSPRRSDSRRRMLESTVALVREHGASATSIDRVLAHSGAPRGSVYHHFPGGRTQLVDEAVALADDVVTAWLRATGERTGDPVEFVDSLFAQAGALLAASGFRAGCPVAAVAVEADDDAPELARACATAFRRWQGVLAGVLVAHGLPDTRARRLAALVVAAYEGAIVMCRAERGPAALDDAAAEIHELITAATHRNGNEEP